MWPFRSQLIPWPVYLRSISSHLVHHRVEQECSRFIKKMLLSTVWGWFMMMEQIMKEKAFLRCVSLQQVNTVSSFHITIPHFKFWNYFAAGIHWLSCNAFLQREERTVTWWLKQHLQRKPQCIIWAVIFNCLINSVQFYCVLHKLRTITSESSWAWIMWPTTLTSLCWW